MMTVRSSTRLILKHEAIEHNRTGSLPAEDYQFDYETSENWLSDNAFMLRPYWIGIGYASLVVQVFITAFK